MPGPALRGRIEESFVRRLKPLPEDTRRLLLVAAAEPVGDPLLLWRAAARLGIGPTAARSAQEDGLLMIGQGVIFRHPLVRSAMYRSAAVEQRRAVHLALAEATDGQADPDRRGGLALGCSGGPASAPCSTGWCRTSAEARVGHWSCGARLVSARVRCWST